MRKQKPISADLKGENSGCGRVVCGSFGVVCMAGSLVFFFLMGLQPYLQKRQAADWPSAPCEILKAERKTHSGDNNRYSIDFRYSFLVDNKRFFGTRYSFADSKASYEETSRQQTAFPAGSNRQCFYNPRDPLDCVLDRINQNQGWLPFFLPLIFVVVGGLMAYFAFFGRWSEDEKSMSGSIKTKNKKAEDGEANSALTVQLGGSQSVVSFDNPADQLDLEWAEPLKLKPATSRVAGAIGISFFALLCNAVIVGFVAAATDGFQTFGWEQLGIGLVLTPFVLVGLLLMFFAFYSVMAIFNPKVEIALSSGAVPLGGTVDVVWQIDGRAERIKKINIHVLASQSATYQRGTDTTTDVEVFEKLLVIESADINEVRFGSTSVTIPADSMHTFDAKRNKIKWAVMVHGEIPWSPDVNEEYEFRVTPTQTESRSS